MYENSDSKNENCIWRWIGLLRWIDKFQKKMKIIGRENENHNASYKKREEKV